MVERVEKIIDNAQSVRHYLVYLNLVLVSLVLGLIVFYGISLASLIKQGVFINDFYSSINGEKSEVIDLEARYVALKGTITMELAESLGFKEVPNPKYITRKTAGLGLSLGDEI